MRHDGFWHDGNMADDGVTPPRPIRSRDWVAPSGFPSCERPYVWDADE